MKNGGLWKCDKIVVITSDYHDWITIHVIIASSVPMYFSEPIACWTWTEDWVLWVTRSKINLVGIGTIEKLLHRLIWAVKEGFDDSNSFQIVYLML